MAEYEYLPSPIGIGRFNSMQNVILPDELLRSFSSKSFRISEASTPASTFQLPDTMSFEDLPATDANPGNESAGKRTRGGEGYG